MSRRLAVETSTNDLFATSPRFCKGQNCIVFAIPDAGVFGSLASAE